MEVGRIGEEQENKIKVHFIKIQLKKVKTHKVWKEKWWWVIGRNWTEEWEIVVFKTHYMCV